MFDTAHSHIPGHCLGSVVGTPWGWGSLTCEDPTAEQKEE